MRSPRRRCVRVGAASQAGAFASVGDEIFAPLDRSERAQLTELLKRVMDPMWGKPK